MSSNERAAALSSLARWWVGAFGAIGAALAAGASVFDLSHLVTPAKWVYLGLLAMGLVLAVLMVLDSRRLFTGPLRYELLSSEVQADGLKALHQDSDTLKRLERVDPKGADDIKGAIADLAWDSDLDSRLREIGSKVRIKALVCVGLLMCALVLREVPSMQMPICPEDLSRCPALPVSETYAARVRLARDAADSLEHSRLWIATRLADPSCKVPDEFEAEVLGGTSVEPLVLVALPGCVERALIVPVGVAVVSVR